MKRTIILFLALALIGLEGCGHSIQVKSTQVKSLEQTDVKNTTNSNWKTYSNDKLGITFQIPNTWIFKESNAINLKGDVISVMINFIDTISNSTFLLEKHLAPYGAELFKFEKDQFDRGLNGDAEQIEIAGNMAIKTHSTIIKDIKGNIYDPPLKIVNIVFLDKQQTSEFAMTFNTTLPNEDSELAKLNTVISTFKFVDDLKNK